MLTGEEGWYKRINRDIQSMQKRSRLTDELEINEEATGKIHAAAKAVALKRKAATISLPNPNLASSSSSSSRPAEFPPEWSSVPSSSRTDDAPHEGQFSLKNVCL